jgi:hypothetical protein
MSQDVREEPAKPRQDPKALSPDPVSSPVVIADPGRIDTSSPPSRPAKTGVPLRPLAKPGRSAKGGGLQRAVGLVRAVAPVVQKVLPLLEGNVALTLANFLAPRPASQHVNLEPIENAVMKMRKDQVDLRLSVADQSAALRRIADQVEIVKDSTERNALEAKELRQDVRSLRAKVNTFAWAALGLLLLSIVLNIVLFSQLRQLVH